VDYFGEQLAAAGFSHGGSEIMYSGVTGEPLPVDIYYGCVYYQRLRHMVNDKAQVRSTGPVNALTTQPVKGRKKGGGIRFGEMERDSLLAHGAAFLLHDRLHSSSDRHIALVCVSCGSLIAPYSSPTDAAAWGIDVGATGRPGAGAGAAVTRVTRSKRTPSCLSCGTGAAVRAVAMPYVFRYLVQELAAMGVRIILELGEGPYGAEGPGSGKRVQLGAVRER
jgi:DNA-directed RNA polymerase I subunit RPA2